MYLKIKLQRKLLMKKEYLKLLKNEIKLNKQKCKADHKSTFSFYQIVHFTVSLLLFKKFYLYRIIFQLTKYAQI